MEFYSLQHFSGGGGQYSKSWRRSVVVQRVAGANLG